MRPVHDWFGKTAWTNILFFLEILDLCKFFLSIKTVCQFDFNKRALASIIRFKPYAVWAVNVDDKTHLKK